MAALLFVAGGVWVAQLDGYVIVAGADPAALSNPLAKLVSSAPGAWLAKYARWPLLWLLPALGGLSALAGAALARAGRAR